VKLSLCSIEYKIAKDKPVIVLFTRDFNGKRHIIKDYSFLPYFYIWKGDKIFFLKDERSQIPIIHDLEVVKYEDIKIKSIDNKPLEKVVVKKPSIVRDIRERYPKDRKGIYEADILFTLRYLIDKEIKSGIIYNELPHEIKPCDMPSNLKIIYLDIEVLAEKIPDLKDASVSVVCIGLYDTLEKRYYQLYLVPPFTFPKKIEYKNIFFSTPKIVENKWFKNETNLIKYFISLINKLEPDVILTFTTFDILYLINRCKRLNIKYNSLSPLFSVRIFEDDRINIKGIQVFDLSEMYRIVMGEPKWETLEDICQRELKQGRIYHKEKVSDMFFSDYSKVLYRNIKDVELIKELDKTCQLLQYFDTIRLVVGCNLKDTLYPSRIADILYLRETHNKVVLYTKSPHKKIPYKGAKVFESKKGIFDNVLVVDFNEMYPSIIDTFNISYNTFDETNKKGEINIDNKYRFFKNPRGWTPIIMNKLRPIRKRIKEKLKNTKDPTEYKRLKAISDGYKAIINALYGLYGFAGDYEKHIPASRLYNVKIAECITYLGRTIQEECVVPSLKKIGYEMIYGDTDSIFIKLKNNRPNEETFLISYLNEETKNFIQDRWKIESKIKLDIDTIFKRLIMFGVKKRYKGITVEGRIITKGLEIIRKDTADITADVQNTISNMILEKRSKKEIISYIRKILKEYKQYPLTYISIPKKLSKIYEEYKGVKKGKGIPEHVKAFKKGIELLGEDLKEGERFYLIHVLIPKKINNKVIQKTLFGNNIIQYNQVAIGYKNPNKIIFKINYKKMIKLTIKDKIKDLLELLNIKWDDIIQGINIA